jgi:hypothetical protein
LQIILGNRYEALASVSDTSDCRNKTKWIRKNGNVSKPKVTTNSQKVNRIYTEQDSLVINKPQEEVNGETSVHHNLQNPSTTRCQVNSQTKLITCAILGIINGRLSRQNASKLVNLKTSAKKWNLLP